jgi:glycosyltransferase involved in cell wall biosynthesis
MVTHSYYESDNRVQRYARALAQRGDQVMVLALRRTPDLPLAERLDGVTVHRIQDRFDKKIASKSKHLWDLGRFMEKIARTLRASSGPPGLRSPQNWDLIHVHNVPDFLVHATAAARRRGSKVILDIHDLMPEFYADKFGASKGSWPVELLSWLERSAAAQADHVIVANDLWVDRYAQRCKARERCSVMINHVDHRQFPRRPFRAADPRQPLMIFPGGFEKHQGLDVAIEAFALLQTHFPGAQFHLYGDGSMKADLQALARRLKVERSVKWFQPLPLHAMAQVMSTADVGVVPKRADGFGNEAFSTKILEFMAVGVPVVASKTRVDEHYFSQGGLRFFAPGDSSSLAQALMEVLRDPLLQGRLVQQGFECADRLGWSAHEHRYLDLVDRLTGLSAPKRAKTLLAPPRTSFQDLEIPS